MTIPFGATGPSRAPLGEEIRSAICQEDEYTFFRLKDGQCPFLNKEKLCRLILGLGEDVLSVTCREHPRFWEEYGARRGNLPVHLLPRSGPTVIRGAAGAM